MFDINLNGLALLFSGDNSIESYAVGRYSIMNYNRLLPLYTFRNDMIFCTEAGLPRNIIFDRIEEYLFVLFKNRNDETDKRLFIYNLLDNSNRALRGIVKINKALYLNDISLTADVSSTLNRIFIYLFYDGKMYQYVTFRRENAVERATNETRNLFLPGSVENLPYYPDDNHTLVIRPSETGSKSAEHENCLYLELNCTNYGLMIESRIEERKVAFKESFNGITISLLDFIDGFNTSYRISNQISAGLQATFSK